MNISNLTFPDPDTCSTIASVCKPGVLIPTWYPVDNLSLGDTIARALVYGLSLIFCFLGVSIISDRFMSAIEVITSEEKEIHIVDNDGNKQVVMVRYWNETVSNLTVCNSTLIPTFFDPIENYNLILGKF